MLFKTEKYFFNYCTEYPFPWLFLGFLINYDMIIGVHKIVKEGVNNEN